jgi:hypothetical protein
MENSQVPASQRAAHRKVSNLVGGPRETNLIKSLYLVQLYNLSLFAKHVVSRGAYQMRRRFIAEMVMVLS